MAKIIGNTTATPNPRPDWNQTDETKADYIKNKPEVGDILTVQVKDGVAVLQHNNVIYDTVTAYDLAQEKGFTGTEDEWYEQVLDTRNAALNAKDAEEFKEGAETAAQTATEARDDIVEIKEQIDVYAEDFTYIKNNIDSFAKKEDVAQSLADMIDSAPETLNTLKELSNALGDDPNFATTVATKIGNKVDKVDGKGLSTNDYTAEEKKKLAGIADGAKANVQADWNNEDINSDSFIKNKPQIVQTTGDDENSIMSQKAVTDAIKATDNIFSNVLKGHKTGAVISASDVSPNEHDLKIKVSSKNLFHFVRDTNTTSNGLKITAGANTSSFTADGTSTNSSIVGYSFPSMLLPAGTYTLSISDVPFSDKEGADRIHINGKNPLTGSAEVLAYIHFNGTQKRVTFTITETWEVFVNFLFSPGRTWENQEFTVQLEKGTEASGYAPYVADVEGVTVSRYGKNLFMPELEIGGIAGASGNNYSNPAQLRSSVYMPISPASYCVFTTLPEYFKDVTIFVYGKNKERLAMLEVTSTKRAIDLSGYAVGYVRLRIAKQDGTDMTEEDIELAKTAFQIEIGNTATEYEPYIEPITAVADAEGNVEGLMSLAPNMTLVSENGTVIDCTYNRDANKVITDLETKLNTLIATIGGSD